MLRMRSKSGWQDIHLEWGTKEIPAVFRQFRLDAIGGWINGIRQTVHGRGSCLNFATESFEDVAVNVRQTGEMEFHQSGRCIRQMY